MDAQQIAQDVETVRPYLFEIVAFCTIVVSHFLTNLVKKIRFFPVMFCKLKMSADGKHPYHQLKSYYLIGFAMTLSYIGVAWSLLQRYDNLEQVLVITGIVCVMQWVIAEIVFGLAEGTKFEKSAQILKGKMYVPDDATILAKTIAKATGGGVDKKPKSVDFDPSGGK